MYRVITIGCDLQSHCYWLYRKERHRKKIWLPIEDYFIIGKSFLIKDAFFSFEALQIYYLYLFLPEIKTNNVSKDTILWHTNVWEGVKKRLHDLFSKIIDWCCRCNKFVLGPIFCGSGDMFQLHGFPTLSDQWCNVGAHTRYRVMQSDGNSFVDLSYFKMASRDEDNT